MTRIVFMDTETCGLDPAAHIWEVAMIVREPGQPDSEIQTFVQHDPEQAKALPDAFRADHDARYDDDLALTAKQAAKLVRDVTDRAHIVGAVPNFDTERLGRLIQTTLDERPGWHYHLIDVENLAVGYLAGRYSGADARVSLPWDSDELSARLGVVAPVEDRHTALGDCRWARNIYDAVMGARHV